MLERTLVIAAFSGVLASAAAQDAASSLERGSRINVRSAESVMYKDGVDVPVKALLFRYVSRGRKPFLGSGHPRFIHALAITNIDTIGCDTQVFHVKDEKRHGGLFDPPMILDLPVKEEDQFLVVFSHAFSDEPEYAYMGEDSFTMTETGSLHSGQEPQAREAPGASAEALRFAKLDRKEQFAVMSNLMSAIWPFRPSRGTLQVRTSRGDQVEFGAHVRAVRPPNFVQIEGEAGRGKGKKFAVKGELPVLTCK